jgi:hypothetical protein
MGPEPFLMDYRFADMNLIREKFNQFNTWDIMTENQISADGDILRISPPWQNYRYHYIFYDITIIFWL